MPTEPSKVGIHQMEEQQREPTCISGCRKNLWGWRGAKIRTGSGDVSHGQPMLGQQPGWEAVGWQHQGSTLGFGPALGLP